MHLVIMFAFFIGGIPEPKPPQFVEHPKDQFIANNDSVTLTCGAVSAAKIGFKCNGNWIDDSNAQLMERNDDESKEKVTTLTISVTKYDLDSFFSRHKYSCRCEAWSRAGHVTSKKAFVKLANLRRSFTADPVGGSYVVGEEIRLSCKPPKGEPQPTVHWLKNGQPIIPSANQIVTDDNSLIIQARNVADSGDFTCVARNSAANRKSHTASVQVRVNGEWGPWSSWSGCGEKCGINLKRRTRACAKPAPQNGGKMCPGNPTQTQACTKLCPVDGGWTDWSSWSTCSPTCVQRRRRTCTRPRPHNSGQVCPGPDIESQPCNNGYCLEAEDKNTKSTTNSGHPLYDGLLVTVGILFLFLIATLFMMKYKKKRFCFRSRSSPNNGVNENAQNCKECQDTLQNYGFVNEPPCPLPPYAVHDPLEVYRSYERVLGERNFSKNKLLISSSMSKLSKYFSKYEKGHVNKFSPETLTTQSNKAATFPSRNEQFHTRLKCTTV